MSIGKLEKKFLKLYDSATQNKNTDRNDGVKQMKNIDSESVKSYNNDKGGADNEESSDSELLEGRTISTVSGNKDDLRKQSTNSKKMAEYVGNIDKGKTGNRKFKAGESGWLQIRERDFGKLYSETREECRRFRESFIGNLSRIILKKTDIAGRKVDKFIQKEFAETIFKNEEKSNPAHEDVSE